jgi:hypothetical protein
MEQSSPGTQDFLCRRYLNVSNAAGWQFRFSRIPAFQPGARFAQLPLHAAIPKESPRSFPFSWGQVLQSSSTAVAVRDCKT